VEAAKKNARVLSPERAEQTRRGYSVIKSEKENSAPNSEISSVIKKRRRENGNGGTCHLETLPAKRGGAGMATGRLVPSSPPRGGVGRLACPATMRFAALLVGGAGLRSRPFPFPGGGLGSPPWLSELGRGLYSQGPFGDHFFFFLDPEFLGEVVGMLFPIMGNNVPPKEEPSPEWSEFGVSGEGPYGDSGVRAKPPVPMGSLVGPWLWPRGL
jgi:hypothetical protein